MRPADRIQMPDEDDVVPTPPDLGPAPEKARKRSTVSLELWIWDEIESIARDSKGRWTDNDVHNQLLEWALVARKWKKFRKK